MSHLITAVSSEKKIIDLHRFLEETRKCKNPTPILMIANQDNDNLTPSALALFDGMYNAPHCLYGQHKVHAISFSSLDTAFFLFA